MAERAFIANATRHEAALAAKQGVAQLTAAATTIKAVTQQLAALRSTVVADYDQADLDELDALTPRVAAFSAAANAFLG